jgi:hypothetical protein
MTLEGHFDYNSGVIWQVVGYSWQRRKMLCNK